MSASERSGRARDHGATLRSRLRRGSLLLVLVAVVVAFGGSLWGTRVLDDFHSVFDNAPLRDLGNLQGFFVDRSTFSVYGGDRSYRPLVLASYALTFALFGDSLPAFHALNLLLHLLCTALVYRLLLELFETVGVGAPWGPAAVGALVFGVHPAGSQVVHYISSRSESLAALGILGALLCHLRSLAPSGPAGRRLGLRAGSLFFLMLGLMSKETAILTLPLLVAVDLAVQPRHAARLGERLRRLVAPAALVLAYGWVFLGGKILAAQSPFRGAAEGGIEGGSWFVDSLRGIWVYLRLAVWPADLTIWRELPATAAASAWAVGAAVLLLAVLLASAFLLLGRRRRLWGLAGLLFAVPLTPYLFRPGSLVVSENRLYLPLIGLALAAGLVWAGPLESWRRGSAGRRRLTLAVALGLLLAALARDWRASWVWAAEDRLWRQAVSISPLSGDARAGLGTAYMRRKEWSRAREQFVEALRLPSGQRFVIHDNLGIAAYMLGDKAEAMRQFRHAYRLNPSSVEVLNHLGSMLHEAGRPEEGLAFLDRARVLAPSYCEAQIEAVMVMRTLSRAREALHRIELLPGPCQSDPRVRETRQWARSEAARSPGGRP